MKKSMILVAIFALLGFAALAQAAQLSDSQMAEISAGQVDTIVNDQVVATASVVADQKNIAAAGSLNGCLIGSEVVNTNTAQLANVLGDSAVALQANIAALSGLGADCTSEGNSIINTNDAAIENSVDPAVQGSVEGVGEGSTTTDGAGANSAFTSVSALQSAVAAQVNVGAMVGEGDVVATSVIQSNTASIVNGPAL